MIEAEDFNPYAQGTNFKYVCEDCGVPFAQSYDFHKREYHDGEDPPVTTYSGRGDGSGGE